MNSNEMYVSLDIGTSHVKVIIGEMVHETLNIIGVGNVKSNGLKKGSIVDIDETVQSIRKAVEQAERMVNMQIHRVIVGIGANQVQLQPCHGVVAVSNDNREIGNDDVLRVFEAAQVVSVAPEREIVDVVPSQFIVDGLQGIKDPRGMIGVRLELQGTLITVTKTLLHNLCRCVERAGLEIADICLQPLAANTVALSNDDLDMGVALIDIGGGSTTIAVYRDGELYKTSVLPIGGEHITKDIAVGCRTTTENAEQIKLKYGHAYYRTASEDVFNVTGKHDHVEQYTQRELADIIEARLEEIFVMVDQELQRMGIKDIPNGYVCIGGVASISGFRELAEIVLKNNVRVEKPEYIGVREPQYTGAVSLIKHAHQKAKLRGRVTQEVEEVHEQRRVPVPVQQTATKPKPRDKERMTNKVKNFFHSLWE